MNTRYNAAKAEVWLENIEDGLIRVRDRAPILDAADSKDAALYIDGGYISARRMARALGVTFEDIDETFAHHGISVRIGL